MPIERGRVFYGTPVDALDQAAAAMVDVEGLDMERLLEDCLSEKVRAAYRADWEETRRPNDYVGRLAEMDADHLEGQMMKSEGHERYNLPTFIFRGSEGERTMPGYRPHVEYESALEEVASGLTRDVPVNPTPDEALKRWPTMTAKELVVLR